MFMFLVHDVQCFGPHACIKGSSALIIIIITYIYHVLINALCAHMIHINLNTISYTHVEHIPKRFT